MRRTDKQVSDPTTLHDVIKNTLVCRIGLVKDDRPYVVPLSFGFDGNHIYFHSATSGEKVQILKENNHVCVEFEQGISIVETEKPCKWGVNYLSVVVHGTVELVTDPTQKGYGLAQIYGHYKVGGEKFTFTNEELKSVLVYRVTPVEIVGKRSGMQ